MEQGVKRQESNPVIWIIGDNVLMDGVEACLQERQVTNLVRWDAVNPNLDVSKYASKPALVIFELDTPGSFILLDLLKDQPGVHLLGINQNCNQVIVLNSFTRKTQTMTDLYYIVEDVLGYGK